MAEIVLDKVTKSYPDGTVAVHGIDLEIADGEFVILVGPSGCGKSTTLNMIAGLEDITSGELRIGGERVNDRAPKDRDIAMVFQSYALYPNMTVRENMAFPLKLAHLDKAVIAAKVAEAARVLELTDHLDRKPANLSGGQRQRVAMGRAIVRSPKAFLMDEPLSNLDAKLRVQMRTQVSRLQKQLGTTTVYVTHDQTEAMTLGDRVVVMRGGYIQQVGDPQTLYDSPRNLFVAGFIGSPAMNFLPATVTDSALETPLGAIPLTDRLRGVLGSGAPRQLVLGIRPEHFEDAALTRTAGFTFTAPVDLVESMGSDKYVYFPISGDKAVAADLEDLAADAGGSDLPPQDSLVTRLSASSRARGGEDATIWMNLDKIHLFDPATGRNITLDAPVTARHRAGSEAPVAPEVPASSARPADSVSSDGEVSSVPPPAGPVDDGAAPAAEGGAVSPKPRSPGRSVPGGRKSRAVSTSSSGSAQPDDEGPALNAKNPSAADRTEP